MSGAGEPEVLDAGFRLRRLLAMLSYLAEVGEAPLAELAARFSLDEASVVAELELAACCGLPPYTPDQLLELVVEGDRVLAFGLEALRRPPKLTSDEGFALAASARAMLSVPGGADNRALKSALDKLERVLGADRVSVELDAPGNLAALRRAAAEGAVLEIDYRGAGRDAEETRVVEPYAVVAREGHFYLDAFCRRAGDWRRFQLGRIAAFRPTGEHGPARTPPPQMSGTRAFAGGAGTEHAVVALAEGREVLIERFAAAPPERRDGRVLVPVEVADREWFGRLLLRLGPDAEVLEPAALRTAPVEVARRALERYR